MLPKTQISPGLRQSETGLSLSTTISKKDNNFLKNLVIGTSITEEIEETDSE